jgi:hypothetical protein
MTAVCTDERERERERKTERLLPVRSMCGIVRECAVVSCQCQRRRIVYAASRQTKTEGVRGGVGKRERERERERERKFEGLICHPPPSLHLFVHKYVNKRRGQCVSTAYFLGHRANPPTGPIRRAPKGRLPDPHP